MPDTLYFWLDLAVKLWDDFALRTAVDFGCAQFKPAEKAFDVNRYVPDVFRLGQPPNKYRVVVQALDLITLHFKMHKFSRPRLSLALLALIYLNEAGL